MTEKEALIFAANTLRAYYDKHSMGVKEVILSQWVRGVCDGREEAVSILGEKAAKADGVEGE